MRLIFAIVVSFLTAAASWAETAPPTHTASQRRSISAQRIAGSAFHRPRPLRLDEGCVAIDTHVHTEYSPDSRADLREDLEQAIARGLAAIAITDHNTMDALPKANIVLAQMKAAGQAPDSFFIIPGEEITSAQGHVIALYIHTAIPSLLTASETIARIHAQGGLAIAAHPMDRDSLGPLANQLAFDGVETMNAAEEAAYLLKKAAARDRRGAFYTTVTKPRYGASDAHVPKAVGMCYTVLPDCAPTPNTIREALYDGRTEPSDGPAYAARTRGVTRSGRWLTWQPMGFQSAVHQNYTPMLRVPLHQGSLALKLDSGTGILFRKEF